MDSTEFDTNRIKRFKERVRCLKKNLLNKEKMENKELKAKQKLEFVPMKDLVKISLFSRNPFEKMNIFKFNLSKHKMSMDMINRNLQKNNITYALKQAALHYTKPKSRLGIFERDNLISDLKQKIRLSKPLKKSLNKSPKHSDLNITNNTDRIQVINSQRKSLTDRRNYPIKIIKKNNSMTMNSSRVEKPKNFDLSRDKQSKICSFFKIKPQKSITNRPIYTTDINNFIQKYNRLKSQLLKETQKFEELGIMPQEKIDLIMKARAEMKFMTLYDYLLIYLINYRRHQFILSKFKPNKSSQSVREQKNKFIDNITKKIELCDLR